MEVGKVLFWEMPIFLQVTVLLAYYIAIVCKVQLQQQVLGEQKQGGK